MPLKSSQAVAPSAPTDPQSVSAATARCLAGKLGAQPDRVLLALMNDRMVAKGTILQWATVFFQVASPSFDLHSAADPPCKVVEVQQCPCLSGGCSDVQCVSWSMRCRQGPVSPAGLHLLQPDLAWLS